MATLYDAQFKRAKRFLKHAKILKEQYSKSGKVDLDSIIFLYDLSYAFCVFCNHIPDMILKEKNNSIQDKVIKDLYLFS